MELLPAFLSTFAILIFLFYYFSKNYNYWKIKGIPYIPGAVPGLGHVWPMIFLRENFPGMCKKLYKNAPGHSMVGFYHLVTPALLIRDPSLAKVILVNNFSSFHENQIQLDPHLDPLLSTHPFFNNGDAWKKSRVRVTNAFSTRKLKVLLNSINGVCLKMSDYLSEKVSVESFAELELKDLFSRYTAEVVANAIFGIEGHAFDDKPNPRSFSEIGKVVFESTVLNGITQNLVFFLPKLARICKVSLVPPGMDSFFRKTMKEVLESRKREDIVRNDFLQIMIDQEKVNHENIDESVIVSHAASFFLDVYETSSISLSFLAFLIAHNPEIQEKSREEIKKVLCKFGGVVCYEALQEMTYMEQVLNESMRLYPAAGSLMKICTEEFQLTGSDGISCNVEPGTILVIPTEAYHVDPLYWPNPDKFDPDRFSEEQKRNRNKFSFLPFGEGPRICVGMRLAVMQVKAAMVTILEKYSLEVSSKTQLPLKRDSKTLMSIAEGGLWIYVKRLVDF
ncbi:probable cytochrome P450 6a13 [Belonocnema kinseyi]|uniref:probable cytochrome P450 6a13 n=1 Tax=Belonocnema kinseyi TaxID=2817044 RepID=UPI00143D3AB7|nr:probable cytochrome P450 6a13 [Belonocnema kinseyi]